MYEYTVNWVVFFEQNGATARDLATDAAVIELFAVREVITTATGAAAGASDLPTLDVVIATVNIPLNYKSEAQCWSKHLP